jgi:hypothetical protein
MILSLPFLPFPTQPIPTQLKNKVRDYGNRGFKTLAWQAIKRSPLDNVVGGNSTTSTTAQVAVVSNYAGNGPGYQNSTNRRNNYEKTDNRGI